VCLNNRHAAKRFTATIQLRPIKPTPLIQAPSVAMAGASFPANLTAPLMRYVCQNPPRLHRLQGFFFFSSREPACFCEAIFILLHALQIERGGTHSFVSVASHPPRDNSPALCSPICSPSPVAAGSHFNSARRPRRAAIDSTLLAFHDIVPRGVLFKHTWVVFLRRVCNLLVHPLFL